MVDAGRQRGTVGRPRKRPRPSTALTADMGAVDLPVDPRLAAVCALVHTNPADQRTLAALGAATGTGERTLSRLFRHEFGMTFPQWRTQSRLYHALRLLADDTPVTTVAHRCGWSSASAFIDVFRTAYGYTPGRHRRSARRTLPAGNSTMLPAS